MNLAIQLTSASSKSQEKLKFVRVGEFSSFWMLSLYF